MKKYQAKSRKGLIGGIIAGLLVIGAVTSVAVLSKGFTNFDYKNWFSSETPIEEVDTRANLRTFDFTSEEHKSLNQESLITFLNSSNQEEKVVFDEVVYYGVEGSNGHYVCINVEQDEEHGIKLGTLTQSGEFCVTCVDGYEFSHCKIIAQNYCDKETDGTYTKESGGSALEVCNYWTMNLPKKASNTEPDDIITQEFAFNPLANSFMLRSTKGRPCILGLELYVKASAE